MSRIPTVPSVPAVSGTCGAGAAEEEEEILDELSAQQAVRKSHSQPLDKNGEAPKTLRRSPSAG